MGSVSSLQLNKALLSSFQFDCYFLILLSQLVFSGVFCWCTREMFGNPFDVPVLTSDLMLK